MAERRLFARTVPPSEGPLQWKPHGLFMRTVCDRMTAQVLGFLSGREARRPRIGLIRPPKTLIAALTDHPYGLFSHAGCCRASTWNDEAGEGNRNQTGRTLAGAFSRGQSKFRNRIEDCRRVRNAAERTGGLRPAQDTHQLAGRPRLSRKKLVGGPIWSLSQS
jgi:hypothetical protein